jgi:integrase
MHQNPCVASIDFGGATGSHRGSFRPALINRVMLENLQAMSRVGAQQMCGSLRMYLRFLAATGACSPALVGAIPRVPRWRLATLPRYILADDVERVIASCDLTTPRGMRDRAILLLLARLALRRGDVGNLRLHDIDWDNASSGWQASPNTPRHCPCHRMLATRLRPTSNTRGPLLIPRRSSSGQ